MTEEKTTFVLVDDRIKPTCPVHNEELRREPGTKKVPVFTGYCEFCTKHYDLCSASQHMAMCVKLKDHSGFHIDQNLKKWKDIKNEAAFQRGLEAGEAGRSFVTTEHDYLKGWAMGKRKFDANIADMKRMGWIE